jgi:hypothetical protein
MPFKSFNHFSPFNPPDQVQGLFYCGAPFKMFKPYRRFPLNIARAPTSRPTTSGTTGTIGTSGTRSVRYFGGAGTTVPHFLHVRSFSSLEKV